MRQKQCNSCNITYEGYAKRISFIKLAIIAQKPGGDKPTRCALLCLLKISLQKSLEGLAVAGLVTNVTEKPSNINTFFKNPTWLDTIFVL